MKNLFITTGIVIITLLFASTGSAQSRTACIPKTGYWVLVSNIHVKKATTVQFYTDAHQLIYEEQVKDQKLNLNRLKTLRCLRKGLDSALIAWNQQKKAVYNKNCIAANLK
ncbi:hypothetical protein [Arcticibacter eurypsychrophilus]|uniref:hypothetical protein n=1 Tax=Arcticibacter eurypsychrophilus TaxID=1434752 RepID=UPI00084CF2C9|nr:hypothetical protein [Arcticibacter eurypsychrophilus]